MCMRGVTGRGGEHSIDISCSGKNPTLYSFLKKYQKVIIVYIYCNFKRTQKG